MKKNGNESNYGTGFQAPQQNEEPRSMLPNYNELLFVGSNPVSNQLPYSSSNPASLYNPVPEPARPPFKQFLDEEP
jgi:hypothetical protein